MGNLQALVRDPHLCEGAGIERDVVRDLVQARILAPEVSPRGRGKVRLWSRRDFDRIALIRPLRAVRYSSHFAGFLTAQISNRELDMIAEAAPGAHWRLGVYNEHVALLSAPDPIGTRLLAGRGDDRQWLTASELEAVLNARLERTVLKRLPSLLWENETARSINATQHIAAARLKLSVLEAYSEDQRP